MGSTYARTIIDQDPNASVLMADIGAQGDAVIGPHQKNAVKISTRLYTPSRVLFKPRPSQCPPRIFPPFQSFPGLQMMQIVLSSTGSIPSNKSLLIFCLRRHACCQRDGHSLDLCLFSHQLSRIPKRGESPINQKELDTLLQRKTLLDVNGDQFDESIRHRVVKSTLTDALKGSREVRSIPLAARRCSENKKFVTWSGSNTVLSEDLSTNKNRRFTLSPETRVTRLARDPANPSRIVAAVCRNLKTARNILVVAKVCRNDIINRIRPDALGKNLTEQSIVLCKIVLKRSIVGTNPAYKALVAEHREKHPNDLLPIPFDDPNRKSTVMPSRMIYASLVNPTSSRLEDNQVTFNDDHTDIYGLLQPTFSVKRSREDGERDHRMMQDMTSIANILGGYLPGSEPQFMEAGLALHITGTTRIGNDPKTSVADPSSKVVIAIKGAESPVAYLNLLCSGSKYCENSSVVDSLGQASIYPECGRAKGRGPVTSP
ncbi:pyranose 2-oxidase [Armillaria nabsnona]|nr:pyranose 2-oxidase [Armillaria nabsnona]